MKVNQTIFVHLKNLKDLVSIENVLPNDIMKDIIPI